MFVPIIATVISMYTFNIINNCILIHVFITNYELKKLNKCMSSYKILCVCIPKHNLVLKLLINNLFIYLFNNLNIIFT